MLPRQIAERTDIKALAKLTLAVLCDHIGHNDYAWPGYRLLKIETGCRSSDTLQNALAELEHARLITIEAAEAGAG